VSADLITAARQILRALSMDDARANERSGLTLLALLRLRPGDTWRVMQNPP